MKYFWNIAGKIKVKKEKIREAETILNKWVEIESVKKDGTIEFSLADEESSNLPYDLIRELTQEPGMVESGGFEAADEDEGRHRRFLWKNGKFEETDGTVLVYYPGFEDELICRLPAAVIDRIRATV